MAPIQYHRQLNLKSLLKKKSFFLLGPRATGKSFLIRKQLLEDAVIINLLKGDLLLRLSAHTSELEALIEPGMEKNPNAIVVIDEVQKIPALLDEVHRLIEEKHWRFLLTGSSARKLKYGNANLLAGRAWTAHLFPLSWCEIPNFNLERYLRYGGLPSVYASEDPEEELNAYTKTYLYEEIQAESLVRNLPQFSRFLTTAALTNSQLLNYAEIANDASMAASTVKEHYSILEDTLIGFQLPPWIASKKRKAIATAKFYFFDTGVVHTLTHTKTIERNSDLYGRSFEHWIAMELRAYLSYQRRDDLLCFWRSTNKDEVDFIIGDHTAIEVKATRKVEKRNLRGLEALAEEKKLKRYILVSQDGIEQKIGNVECMHWKNFMQALWSKEII